jgi:hypothetical protein
MRRTHLRHHRNILKRLLVHVAGCNLGLLMRSLFGLGTPRGLQGLLFVIWRRLQHHYQALQRIVSALRDLGTNVGGWNSLFRSAC